MSSYISVYPVLKVDYPVQNLADKYLRANIIPSHYPIDALHIACATVNRIDFLVTWNIRHLANPNRRKKLTEFNVENDLFIPQLTTPRELIEIYENDDN